MQKPTAPTIPGMTDTLDFVKNLWGSMNIPGTGMPGMSGLGTPALSTEELDKKIADLKAVESWLNMNISMLRGTIQAMEVQRGTLAALKSMSTSMAEAMRQSGVSPDKMASMPFASFFTPPAQSVPGKPAAPTPSPSASAAAPAGSDANAAGGAAPGMPAAVAWWNLLQEQFTQAVTTAMSPTASGAPAPAPPASAPAPAASSSSAAPSTPTPAAPAAPNQNAAPPGPPAGAAADVGANGNGKARSAKPRSDKP